VGIPNEPHTRGLAALAALLALISTPGSAQETEGYRYGVLIPATSTMVTAWTFPRNPLEDSTLGPSSQPELVRRGYRLFVATPQETPRFTGGNISCGNCHLNAGQRERALPLVGIANVFPEYNKREGRTFSLEDRIIGCFLRSENGTGAGHRTAITPGDSSLPTPESQEVVALAAYISWLSNNFPGGTKLPWRGQNEIAPEHRIPLSKLDPSRGKQLYKKNCTQCHGDDGQGVAIGDKKAGPLWGPKSWNDGAGAARVYTLAGIIRYAMPYLNPGSLTDEEAQQIAAFIDSKPRPSYPFKDRDYLVNPVPEDAVYYKKSR
jgi:thiosulfate dehydrogenase